MIPLDSYSCLQQTEDGEICCSNHQRIAALYLAALYSVTLSVGVLETPLSSRESSNKVTITQSYKIPIHHITSPKMQIDECLKAHELCVVDSRAKK